jgi:hypothetical protein
VVPFFLDVPPTAYSSFLSRSFIQHTKNKFSQASGIPNYFAKYGNSNISIIPRRSCYSHNILSITDTYTAGRSSFTSQTKRSCTIAYLTFAHLSYILGVAEILTESIVIVEGDWRFTPSPDEDGLLNYDYTEEQGTVIAVHSLVRHASLPVDTFILAALILRHLKPEFYDEWYELMSGFQCLSYDKERTREVVIVAAIVQISFIP